jgi:hypothetical protein
MILFRANIAGEENQRAAEAPIVRRNDLEGSL